MTVLKKDRRINIRATVQEEQLLREAADLTATTMSDFVLSVALDRAAHVLADSRVIELDPEAFEAFSKQLDQPMSWEKLMTLLQRESVFGKPFELDD